MQTYIQQRNKKRYESMSIFNQSVLATLGLGTQTDTFYGQDFSDFWVFSQLKKVHIKIKLFHAYFTRLDIYD